MATPREGSVARPRASAMRRCGSATQLERGQTMRCFKASVALPRGHRRGYAAREKRGSAMRRCGSATRLGACAVQHVALPQVVKSVARPCVAASVALPRGRGFSLGENLGYLEPKFFNYPKSQEVAAKDRYTYIHIYICIYIYMIKALTAAAETASIERQCYKPRILSVFVSSVAAFS